MTNLFDLVNYSYTVVKMLWAVPFQEFSNPENDTDETLTTSGGSFETFLNPRGILKDYNGKCCSIDLG